MSIPPQDPSAEAKPKDAGGGGGFLDKFKKAVEDNYNGLYVIVLKPRMPEGILYGIGILGLLIGMLWAYAVAPTVWAGGNPNRLNEGSQRQWLLMIAVGASAENEYSDAQVEQLAQAIPNPRATIMALLADPASGLSDGDEAALNALLDKLPQDIDSRSATAISDAGFISAFFFSFLIPVIVMVIVVVVVVLIWRFFIYDNFVAPLLSKIRELRDPAYAAEVQRGKEGIRIAREQRDERDKMRLESASSDLGEPVMQNLAIFASGRSFDESYEIELESGEFLGQSGANISDDVAPDPVAIDVWLFDIFDSLTPVKTFITPQGNADPNIRNRVLSTLDSPNDLVVATPDALLTVDSPKLRLQAKFSSLEINENGRFANFKMVMRAWQKEAGGARIAPPMPVAPAPMPSGAPPMSSYDNIQFDPPPPPAGAKPMSAYDDISFDPPPVPPPPAGAKPMSAYDDISFDPPPAMPQRPAVQPLQPPPLRPQAPQPLQPPPLRRQDDDDPFGGTGDFTPLNG